MTLATRCPHCATIFRVVPDQLRVSQGWVRCGRCTEAFNALETMVDWPPRPAAAQAAEETDAPPETRPTAAFAAPPAAKATAPDESAPESEFPRTLPPNEIDAEPPAPADAAERPAPLAASPGADFVMSDAPWAPSDPAWAQTGPAVGVPEPEPEPEPDGVERTEPTFGFDRPANADARADARADTRAGAADEASPSASAVDQPPPGAGDESHTLVGTADGTALAVEVPAAAGAFTAEGVDDGRELAMAAEPPVADAATSIERAAAAASATATPSKPAARRQAASDDAADDAAGAPAEAPSFIRKADRAERWRRPGVRAALAVASVLLGALLAGQAGFTFRDRIAATSPALKPWLQQACATLGCRVGEFRQIESLSVESSALVKVESAPVYRLSVTLRNRADLEVAAPALDLALTDAQGRSIARRVLLMSDLGLPLRSLKPRSELPIQATLGIGERPVSGYTVEIFYP